MQIRPFEELEEIARKRYKAAYANVPEPTIINLEALVQFTAPVREFQVGGIGLRAPPVLGLRVPPLPFLVGVRLMIAVNGLKAALEKYPAGIDTARHKAVSLIPQAVQPIRLYRRLRGGWLRYFSALPPEEVEKVLRWLLYVPDDSSFPPPEKPGTMDFKDAVVGVVREFPAWVDHKTGLPRLWMHYVYGSHYLIRERARQRLTWATAVRIGRLSDEKGWNRFQRDECAVAGWN